MEINKIRPLEVIRAFLTGSEEEKRRLVRADYLEATKVGQKKRLTSGERIEIRAGARTRGAIGRRRFLAGGGLTLIIGGTILYLSSTNTESETDDDVIDEEVKKQGLRLNPTERNLWTPGVFRPYTSGEVNRMSEKMLADETNRRFFFVTDNLMPRSSVPLIKNAVDYLNERLADTKKPRETEKDLVVELRIRDIATQKKNIELEPRLDNVRVAWIIRPYAAFILTASPAEIALEIVRQVARIKRYKEIFDAMDSSKPITDREMELDAIFNSESVTGETIAYAAEAQAYINIVGLTGVRSRNVSYKAANFIKCGMDAASQCFRDFIAVKR